MSEVPTKGPLQPARGLLAFLLLALMGLLLAPSPAASAEATEAFRTGVKRFRAGDHSGARRAFERARAAGMESAALYHNLGVTYFHLGLLEPARRAFQRLSLYPADAPLAYYNLGLVAQKAGRPFTAHTHFETAHALASDPRLRRLAARQLERQPGHRPAQRWSGYLSVAAGYDTNALLYSDSELQQTDQPPADAFGELMAAATYQARGQPRDGLQVKASAYSMQFRDNRHFRQGFYQMGVELDRGGGAWETDWAVQAGAVTLAGEIFEGLYTLEAEGKRPLGRGWQLALDQETSRVAGSGEFSYLTGWRLRSGVALSHQPGRLGWELAYRYEHNERRDRKAEGDFYSYSPRRHELALETAYRPTAAWHLALGGSYRHSRYADPHRIGGLSRRRTDRRYRLTAEARRGLAWRGLYLVAAYSRTINHSTLDGGTAEEPDYGYRSSIYRLGVERIF